MFVCLCHAVTDHEINAAIESGVDSVNALVKELKVATQCGGCLGEVSSLVAEHQQERQQVPRERQMMLEEGVGFYTPEYC